MNSSREKALEDKLRNVKQFFERNYRRQDEKLADIPGMIDAALALPSEEPDSVAWCIKPLRWKLGEARSLIGDLYAVSSLSGSVWQVRLNGTAFTGWHPTKVEAEAAAQTHYERRVLECLDRHPAPSPGMKEALEEIARQKKTDELETEYNVEVASFEDGYDLCIDRARAALSGDGDPS